MFWQNSDTQAVPSACSRWPPVGRGALRSKTPMLSSPRKPPSKRFLPNRSLRFTHQLKFSVSLANERLRNSRSPFPFKRLLRPIQENGGPGVHRRIDVAEVPLVGRDLTRSDAGRTPAASGRAVPWRNPVSTVESAMVWNARSHAAYHGYSHLSGIEMMCWFTMWNHSLFRMERPPGFIGSSPCSVSHRSTSKKKNCLDQSIPASA